MVGNRLTTVPPEHSAPEILSLYLRLNHATLELCRTANNFRMLTDAYCSVYAPYAVSYTHLTLPTILLV